MKCKPLIYYYPKKTLDIKGFKRINFSYVEIYLVAKTTHLMGYLSFCFAELALYFIEENVTDIFGLVLYILVCCSKKM